MARCRGLSRGRLDRLGVPAGRAATTATRSTSKRRKWHGVVWCLELGMDKTRKWMVDLPHPKPFDQKISYETSTVTWIKNPSNFFFFKRLKLQFLGRRLRSASLGGDGRGAKGSSRGNDRGDGEDLFGATVRSRKSHRMFVLEHNLGLWFLMDVFGNNFGNLNYWDCSLWDAFGLITSENFCLGAAPKAVSEGAHGQVSILGPSDKSWLQRGCLVANMAHISGKQHGWSAGWLQLGCLQVQLEFKCEPLRKEKTGEDSQLVGGLPLTSSGNLGITITTNTVGIT